MKKSEWFQLNNANQTDSPALLLYPDRIRSNINEMVKYARNAENLTPHVKTIKMTHIVKMELEAGIRNFKCATIAEAEMIALSQGRNNRGELINAGFILIAYQLNENKLNRLIRLIKKYPNVQFASLVDNYESAELANNIFKKENKKARIFIDVDNGMHRTGFPVEGDLPLFYLNLQRYLYLKVEGIHVYDGHINDQDFEIRKDHWQLCFDQVMKKIDDINTRFHHQLKIVYGGTPTFPFTSKIPDISCSPGTTVLWDYGYGSLFPEMPFIPSAVVLTRIISKVGKNLITTDLGYKSVSSENSIDKRIFFLNLKAYKIESQSEEHLVIQVPDNSNFNIGDALYGIPYHICPTVASYDVVQVVVNGEITDKWEIEARKRKITV